MSFGSSQWQNARVEKSLQRALLYALFCAQRQSLRLLCACSPTGSAQGKYCHAHVLESVEKGAMSPPFVR
jgi:hypothetical protein